MTAHSFFDLYPEFFETSRTGTKTREGHNSQRLPNRYTAIFESNSQIYKDARVLDMASHDGRWSMAALHLGASHVLGIEGRPELVQAAGQTMAKRGVARERYEFTAADVVAELPKLAAGRFDVILCLGFFYHTLHHFKIFEEFERLQPKHVILDTQIVAGKVPMIRYRYEDPVHQGSTIGSHPGKAKSLIGWPNEEMIAMLAEFFGFAMREIAWSDQWVKNWSGCDDYKAGQRKTFALSR